MKGIRRLEEKYGIKVVDDSFVDPLTHKYYKRYKMYSADGCPWENGMTYNDLQAECKKYAKTLLEIKENAIKH